MCPWVRACSSLPGRGAVGVRAGGQGAKGRCEGGAGPAVQGQRVSGSSGLKRGTNANQRQTLIPDDCVQPSSRSNLGQKTLPDVLVKILCGPVMRSLVSE